MRAHDINERRRIRYGMAVLLGAEFERHVPPYWDEFKGARVIWRVTIYNLQNGVSLTTGTYETRHEAVDWALMMKGIK